MLYTRGEAMIDCVYVIHVCTVGRRKTVDDPSSSAARTSDLVPNSSISAQSRGTPWDLFRTAFKAQSGCL